MIPQALADNVVRRQLGRLIADAEALLAVVAWRDLPAGLRIIDCAGGRIAGGSLGSGHKLARAHGCRPGAVAVLVAAEYLLRGMLELWGDDLDAAISEAAAAIEYVAGHELAHALGHEPDDELRDGEGDILRRLPAAVGTIAVSDNAERTARDHGAAWAAAIVILSQRCMVHRPWPRHRWPILLANDLKAVGIDHDQAVDAVGAVGDELPLRDLLAPGGDVVARVADAIPSTTERAAIIAAQLNTTPDDPGHVAPVAAGVAEE